MKPPCAGKARRLSVYLTPESLKVLDDTIWGTSTSARLNAVLCRYRELVRAARPDFTAREWGLIFDALYDPILGAGRFPDPASDDIDLGGWLWATVRTRRDLSAEWGVSASAIGERLRTLPYPAQIAVVETAAAFSSMVDRSPHKAFRALGLPAEGLPA